MPVCWRRGGYNPALEILSSKKKSEVNYIIPELTILINRENKTHKSNMALRKS